MKASFKVQMGQQISLTPQLLQSIRLLQLDSQQLALEVNQVLAHNPLLERDEEDDTAADEAGEHTAAVEAAAWDELPESALWNASPAGAAQHGGEDDPILRLPDGGSSDLRVRIVQALALELDASDLAVAAFILDHVDDNGYLEAPLADLEASAFTQLGCDARTLRSVREHILNGEIPGIAAIDLRDCLLAQLDALPAPAPGRCLAALILDHHLDALAAHDVALLATRLDVDGEQVLEAISLILSLQPRPGQDATLAPGTHVVPDVLAWRAGGEWRVSLNGANTPRVRIDSHYERLLDGCDDSAGTLQMRGLLHEARWFTRGLAMRHDTLLRTSIAIVERQQAFLMRGDEAMAPLTLRVIADAIDMHESTVSRIINGKFLQTPRGTIELKRFFAVRLDGASVSGPAVRAMVKRLIDGETAGTPLGDDAIALLLARDGVTIARRTVAKYREQLHIAPARQRRLPAAPRFARAS